MDRHGHSAVCVEDRGALRTSEHELPCAAVAESECAACHQQDASGAECGPDILWRAGESEVAVGGGCIAEQQQPMCGCCHSSCCCRHSSQWRRAGTDEQQPGSDNTA